MDEELRRRFFCPVSFSLDSQQVCFFCPSVTEPDRLCSDLQEERRERGEKEGNTSRRGDAAVEEEATRARDGRENTEVPEGVTGIQKRLQGSR